jgi:hypothetical protein
MTRRNAKYQTPNTEYQSCPTSVLDIECWMFDILIQPVARRTPNIKHQTLNIKVTRLRCWLLDVGCSIFFRSAQENTKYQTPNTEYQSYPTSVLVIGCWMFDILALPVAGRNTKHQTLNIKVTRPPRCIFDVQTNQTKNSKTPCTTSIVSSTDFEIFTNSSST